jgi:hypothetical protein
MRWKFKVSHWPLTYVEHDTFIENSTNVFQGQVTDDFETEKTHSFLLLKPAPPNSWNQNKNKKQNSEYQTSYTYA